MRPFRPATESADLPVLEAGEADARGPVSPPPPRRRTEPGAAAARRRADAGALVAVRRQPLIGVDAAARIGFATVEAAALLDAADGLRAQRGRLAGCTTAATARLREAVRRAAAADAPAAAAAQGGAPARWPLLMPRPSGAALPVVVVPVAAPDTEGAAPAVVALVQAMDTRAAGTGPSPALIRAFLGATPAEAEVALRAARGEGLRAIAAALGVAHSTARSHLHRVFQKAGVRRQAELAWLIAHLPG